MTKPSSKHVRQRALQIALIAVMAALIEAVKMALASIPNVEVVTLFCALFGYVFGWMGMVATLVFVGLETLIWGFNTWVLAYLLHWPSICLVFWLLGKAGVRNRIILTAAAVLLTIAFGVQSSLIDVFVFFGRGGVIVKTSNYWARFAAYYMRGIWFYVAEVATNLVVFPLLFRPLQKLLRSFAVRYGLGTRVPETPKEPADLPLEESEEALPLDSSADVTIQ